MILKHFKKKNTLKRNMKIEGAVDSIREVKWSLQTPFVAHNK